MTTKELREKRNKLIADARELVGAAVNAGTALSAEDKEKVENLRTEARDIGELIRQSEELDDESRAVAEAREYVVPPSQGAGGDQGAEDAKKRDGAFGRFLRFREAPEDRTMLEGAQPKGFEVRTMNTITGAAGGFVVAPDQSFYGQIIEAMKFYGGMRTAGCTILNTSTGADLPIPVDDDTSNEGAIVAEEGSHTGGTNVTIGQKILKSYLFSSKIVKASWQLLNDSSFPFEGYLARKLGQRLGRIHNRKFTVGTGASEPKGIAVGLTVGRTCATGSTTTCTADDLIRLEFSVDQAYRNIQTCRYMLNDVTMLMVSLIKDGEGRYLMQPDITQPGQYRLRGYPIVINSNMVDMAASAVSVLFGDTSFYYIRDVQGMQIVRLNELYAENGQVGFLAFSRNDGGLIDAGQHPVKSLVNSST
uniref:Putative capsid protein n=2 Tax=viral metagenome TaxID=1070528 RepID=A0A6M3J9G9_9ZZZZ